MPEIPPWFTLVAALVCAAFSVLIAVEAGFGANAALVLALGLAFLVASIRQAGGLRKALVWLFSWWQPPS